MKTAKKLVLCVGSGIGLLYSVAAQPADTPAKEQPAPAARTEVLDRGDTPVPDAVGTATSERDPALRLNFRGAPLEMVLNYLSEAAGFIIVPETEIKGKVDVWSNQPLTKDEAVEVLNSVLVKNGYAVIRNGRTLTIVSRDEAKKRNIPVIPGSDPDKIPKTDDIVTQIIPVRYINAVQLTKDLQPLLPAKAELSANEGGNALVLTDTQSNIRRMAEIVKALDTAISSEFTVRVYPLKYADAKALATVIKEVFQTPDSSSQRGGLAAQILNRFRGGGGGNFGPGGLGGPGADGTGTAGGGNSSGRPGASRVAAVADERSNSLVVSAPDELISTIQEVVDAVDSPIEDVTEVRVFHLKYSDPVEMADLLADLFPDDTRTSDNRSQVQFGGGPFGRGGAFFGGGRGGGNATDQSDRSKKQGRVIAVPDRRTSSVVVSAARDLMGQIGEMIAQLDASPAKKQKVYVYPLENADVQSVEEILRGLFESQTSRNTQTRSSQNTNPLNNRNTANQGANTGTGIGNNPGGGGGGQQPR
jgi:general secretion pathway protein D